MSGRPRSAIDRAQARIVKNYFMLTPEGREAKREAVRQRFNWTLPGEHVRPWSPKELAAERERRKRCKST